MKNLDFDKFEKIPASALNNLNEVTTEEILNTNKTARAEDFNFINDGIEEDEDEGTGDHKEEATGTEEEKRDQVVGDLVTGDFVTDLIDAIIPAILVTSIHFLGYQLDKKELQLNAKDKKVLGKATQRALDAIHFDFKNPFVNLAIVATIIYGSKIIELIPEMKKVDKKKKEIEEKQDKDLAELAKPTDEQLFSDEFDKLADKVIETGRRKTRASAKKMLLKEKLDAVNELREQFNLHKYTQEAEFSL